MAEPDLAQVMVPHKTTLVHIATNAGYAALTRILPHRNLAVVGHNGFFVCVHGNHNLVVVNLALQMLVVEVATCIDEWLLLVGLLYKVEEVEQRVAEDISRQASRTLHVNHGYQVLLFRNALRLEVAQLSQLVGLRTIEMIAAHLQALLVSHPNVTLKSSVNAVATLGSLQIDISHVGIVADGFPEDIALIVAEVNAVNMRAGILALYIIILSAQRERTKE